MGPLGLALAVGAGSVISSALSFWNQRRSEHLQTDLANSAVQRRVADLRAAGINPILAAQGQGAPVPSVQPVRFENPMEAAAETYVSAKRLSNESSLVEEQRQKLIADTNVSREQLKNMEATRLLTDVQRAIAVQDRDKEVMWTEVARILTRTFRKFIGDGKTIDQILEKVWKGADPDTRSALEKALDMMGFGTTAKDVEWKGGGGQMGSGGLRGKMTNDSGRHGAGGNW